jgi:hypothetical protein
MPTCPSCGRDIPQSDAAFCSYCGSGLPGQQKGGPTTLFPVQQSKGSYTPGEGLSSDLSKRYEKVLRHIEQLGYTVLILSVVTLVLAFI